MDTIIIEYLTKHQSNFTKQEIFYEDYFDLEKDEQVEIDAVPKYPQPFQYLNIDINDLVFVKLHLEIGNSKRTFNQTFWNNGDNFLTERINAGEVSYKEVILSVKMPGTNDIYETLRLYFGQSFIVPVHHGLVHVDHNGVEVEQQFDINPFIEMVKQNRV